MIHISPYLPAKATGKKTLEIVQTVTRGQSRLVYSQCHSGDNMKFKAHNSNIFGSFRAFVTCVIDCVRCSNVHTLPTQSQFPRDRHKNRKFSTKSLRAIVAHSHICRSFGAKVSIRLCLFARHSDETIKNVRLLFCYCFPVGNDQMHRLVASQPA